MKKAEIIIQKDTCTPVFTAALFIIAKEQYNQMKNLAYCRGKTRGKHMHINYSQRRSFFKKNYNNTQ